MAIVGDALNARVWGLFAKAGFQTKPSEQDPEEAVVVLPGGTRRPVDLLASVPELGVSIIGQNTGASSLGQSVSSYFHDLAGLVATQRADAGLAVLTAITTSSTDLAFARERRIEVWGLAELAYYEAVADSIGPYAKYEILHSFGIRTEEQRETWRILCLRLRQPHQPPQTDLFMFAIDPERLLKTCVIYRRAQGDAAAYQRMLQKSRLPKIRKFVTTSGALLPTNIIVHLSERVTWDPIMMDDAPVDRQGRPMVLTRPDECEPGVLNIPMEYGSLELIDGQHRLFAFAEAEESVRQRFNLVVLGVTGMNSDRKRDTFVGINDNSRRMDPNLVAYLKHTENEEECQRSSELMAIRIAVALNSNSALEGRIKLLDIGQSPVTLKGLSGYDLRSLVSPRGLLRKYHGPTSDEYLRLLRMYCSVLKSSFPEQWSDSKTYIMVTNRGVSAFLKLLKSMFKTAKRQMTIDDLREYLEPLRRDWKLDDWKIDNLKGRYVGSAGWKDFHRDLVSTIQNEIPDFVE